MFPDLIRWLSLPRECVIHFLQHAWFCQESFLKCGDVHLQPQQFTVNHCSLSCVSHHLGVIWESNGHGTNIPAGNSHRCCLFVSLLSLVLPFRAAGQANKSPELHAPSDECELWQNNILLTGGQPSLRRAVGAQWVAITSPTIRDTPWHLTSPYRQSFEVITGNCCSLYCNETTLECPLQSAHCLGTQL